MTSPRSQPRTENAIAPGEMEYRRARNSFRVYPRPSVTGLPSGGSESARKALLRRIRSRHRRFDCWPALFLAGLIGAAILAWHGSDLRTIASSLLLTLAAALVGAAVDRHWGNVTIFFEFTPLAEEAHRAACGIFAKLEKVGGTGWSASVPSVIFPVRFNYPLPGWMRTNVVVPSLSLDEGVIYFLPDRFLVMARNGVRSLGYRSLHLERRLHSPSTSASVREVLHLSWENSSTYAFAFADPRTLQAMETALCALRDRKVHAAHSTPLPAIPASRAEAAPAATVFFPGAV